MPMSRWKNRLLARIFTAFPSLAARWGRRLEKGGGEIPWTPPHRPLPEARVALVTTGGVHLRSQPPFDMGDPDGDARFREIPVDAPAEELTITHDYYNHRDADRDLNLVLPIERLRELEREGAIGALHSPCTSFMGHIDGAHLETLIRETAPQVADSLARGGVDCALLVPA